ncbi:MAG: LemA family protein, partial [Proteobacteria bacterium]|nr:LemA family protein [Pseudomonadota bacterium]
ECISRHREVETRGGRRYTEWRFSPGDELYILGKAKLDRTTGESLVFGHEKDMPFIIANVPEEEVMFRKAMSGLALLGACVSLLFLGAMLVSGSNGQFSSLDFLLSAMIAPAFGFLVVLILMYNDLVFLRQRCERNWANIQVSLKKRRDLVPQLEQVVRQYLAHEQSLQADLAALRERRNQVDSTADLDAYMQHEFDSIEQINARIESYPDLKGIDLIAVFNRRLIKLENEIALIRAGYNDAVMQYETRRQSFPDNILAGLFGFRARDAIRFTRDAHHVPTVKALTA